LAVDERAVGGIQIFDNDFGTAQVNFAMMAGNGTFRNGKSIIINSTDSCSLHLQFVGASGQSFTEYDESGHNDLRADYVQEHFQVKGFPETVAENK